MNTNTLLLKKLSKFKYPLCGDQFKITGKNLCLECVAKHDELYSRRDVSFKDLKESCYSYIFYEISLFSSILPTLFKEFIQKEKFEIESYIVDTFFKNIRREELISCYSLEQKEVILEVLNYLESIYFMESFEIWDYEKEKLFYYHKEEEFYSYINTTKSFWKDNM